MSRRFRELRTAVEAPAGGVPAGGVAGGVPAGGEQVVPELPVAELLEANPDPFYVLDERFRFTFVNEPAAELLATPAGELVGSVLWERFPRSPETALRRQYEHAMRSRSAVAFTTYDAPLGRWFSIRAMPYRAGLAVFFHDVTDVKHAEERWARLAEIRSAQHRIAAEVAADASPGETYELVCAESARLAGAAGSWLLRFENARYRVLARAAPDPGARRHDPPGSVRPVPADGDLERMRRTGRSVVVADGAGGPLGELGLRAAAHLPVRLGAAIWGALVVAWSSPRRDAAEALPWLEELTRLVSAGLSSAEARAELARRAATDPLTGLANRRVLDEELEHSVGRAQRHGHPFTLALFDVDEFKAINDGFGHEVGDEVLRTVAVELTAASRGEDVAARIGGDEFALVLDGSDAPASLAVVERLRAAIRAALRARGLPDATVSAGLCAWEPGRSRVTLLRCADEALYWAKRHGRDAAYVHDVACMTPAAPAPAGIPRETPFGTQSG